jgi:hypothetical protein
MKILRLAVAALVIAGCPGPTFIVQQYNGPPRAREEIAILRVLGSDTVRLLLLDDEDVAAPLESDSRLHIELLPGRHSIAVREVAQQSLVETLTFDAQPNRVYRVTHSPAMRVFEVDRDTDGLVRDVTVDAPLPAPPTVTPQQPVAPPPSEDAGAAL